jgi:hypothetical protein
VGDSDTLELGDTVNIFGYPGIGGETVTFTSGSVAGFSKEPGVRDRRAWIKTDATIAGGNSGGAAVNHDGELVGIPTQAAAGSDVTPVDARPVVDTTGDGRVDHRDTPMAVGGFINGLRPVKLAGSLLAKAGVRGAGADARGPAAPPPQPKPKRRSRRVSGPTFEYEGMRDGMAISQVWARNGETLASEQSKWKDGPRGRKTLHLGNPKGLPDGEYHLVLAVEKQVVAEGQVVLGRRVEDTDTQVSGLIVDAATGRGVPDALVIALRPGVRVRDFARRQRRDMAYTSARTDRKGRFTFPKQLPKGQAYGLVVGSQGYRDLGIESALRIGADAPEHARLNPIPLVRG